jgi:hypothetical protein
MKASSCLSRIHMRECAILRRLAPGTAAYAGAEHWDDELAPATAIGVVAGADLSRCNARWGVIELAKLS